MVRPGIKWVIAILIITLLLLFPLSLFAQTDGVEGDDQPVEEIEVVGDTGEIENGLPEDFVTRESFQVDEENQQRLTLGWQDYVNMFISLAVVLLIVWGISVLFKKFVTVRGLATSTESLKILYTLSLTPTRTLYLIRLGDRILLIGSGDGGMRTLAEIKDPEEVSVMLREIEFKGNFDMNPFRDRLQSLIGEDEGEQVGKDDLRDRQRKLRSAMDRLKNSDDSEI